jgi:hypothetical protein
MPVKKLNANESLFRYNPLGAELKLAIGEVFQYDYDNHRFGYNENPYGEPKIVPLKNLVVQDDFSGFSFDVVKKNKEQHFEIKLKYETEKVLLGLLSRLHTQEKLERRKDPVEMTFQMNEGKIKDAQAYNRTELEINESAHIVGEPDGLKIILMEPDWHKSVVTGIQVNDGKLIAQTSEEQIAVPLNMEPVLFDAVKKLMDAATH